MTNVYLTIDKKILEYAVVIGMTKIGMTKVSIKNRALWHKGWIVVLSALLSVAAYAIEHPKDFITICQQGETCSLPKPSMVAFGKNELYVFKIMQGTFICDVPAFNLDPIPHSANKYCSVPSPRPSGSKKSSSSSQFSQAAIANDNYVIVSSLTGQVLDIQDYNVENGAKIVPANYNGAASQRWTISDLDNGYYAIRSLYSRKSLDVEAWNRTDGADVQQLSWLNSFNQHWTIQAVESGKYTILSRFSGMALDVFESNYTQGADLRMWTYWGGSNQQWTLIRASDIDNGNVTAPVAKTPSISF